MAGGSTYPLANSEHMLVAGEGIEMLNVSTPASFTCIRALGDDGSQEVSACVSSRCWEVQECEVHGSSVRGHLKGCLAFTT